ncbi:hypothetical protein J2783_003519 [Chryseobacterium sediminis]|nr:hypothetical protein [Chryseobacterium sediminis]
MKMVVTKGDILSYRVSENFYTLTFFVHKSVTFHDEIMVIYAKNNAFTNLY